MSAPLIDVDFCVDCLFVESNGTAALEDAGWTGFLPEWDGWMFRAIACGGDDVDDLYCEGHYVAPGRPCDGCGSSLGGWRFCYAAFRRPGSADPGPVSRVDTEQEIG